MSGKKYGLILPNSKSSLSFAPPRADFSKPSVFGDDSDSDEPSTKKLVAIGPGATEKRQARHIQEKALKEDPTVFQYDELYDGIESKRDEEKKAKSSEVKKPKYIGRLLEYAERRKIENERRLERVVQKEREEEGDEFADKESFVTSSYRKKLEELKEAEEREKRDDYLEAIGDVTKQQDLGGFYRHIYEQKMQTKELKEDGKQKSKTPEPVHRHIYEHKSQTKDSKEDAKRKSKTPEPVHRHIYEHKSQPKESKEDARKRSKTPDTNRKSLSSVELSARTSVKSKSNREHKNDVKKRRSKTPELMRKSSSSLEDSARTPVKPKAYREPKDDVKRKSKTPERTRKSSSSIEDFAKASVKPKAYRDDVPKELKTPESLRKSSSSIEDHARTAVPRAYRKRNAPDDGNSSPEPQSTKARKSHLQSNLDADSDFSIESSSDEDRGNSHGKKKAQSTKIPEVVVKQEANGEDARQDFTVRQQVDKNEEIKKKERDESKPKVKKEKKVKKDIWKKRTVGAVFDEALQRYSERKAARKG